MHASLFERADGAATGSATTPRSWSRPTATLVQRTRKLHIPITAGYYEDKYFRPGPRAARATRSRWSSLPRVATRKLGLPTCWDQWFPELARAYSLAGAEVLIYPTAIGSEPDHPGFDTEPLWQQVIVGNGIANGTFMVAVNRIGVEAPLTFYGSSFISDPYGRILVQAPRDQPAVLVADLDLDQRRDWLELFPFLTTRRPDAYGSLTQALSSRLQRSSISRKRVLRTRREVEQHEKALDGLIGPGDRIVRVRRACARRDPRGRERELGRLCSDAERRSRVSPACPASGRSRRSTVPPTRRRPTRPTGSGSVAAERTRPRSSRSAPRPTATATATPSTTPGTSWCPPRPVKLKLQINAGRPVYARTVGQGRPGRRSASSTRRPGRPGVRR